MGGLTEESDGEVRRENNLEGLQMLGLSSSCLQLKVVPLTERGQRGRAQIGKECQPL